MSTNDPGNENLTTPAPATGDTITPAPASSYPPPSDAPPTAPPATPTDTTTTAAAGSSDREAQLEQRVAELEAQVAMVDQLREQLNAERASAAGAQLVAVDTPKQPLAAAPSATSPPAGIALEAPAADHTIGPGSAGAEVTKLALLLEALGEDTYLRLGENPGHVFDDSLMAAVRRLVTAHHQDTADPGELPSLLRAAAAMDVVDAAVWAQLRELEAASA